MILVKDMYDKLATITAFPVYTNETDTPDITRYLLQALSEGLLSTIDDLYLSNNVLERTDTIVTIPNKDKYGIKGIVKNAQLVNLNNNTVVKQLPYNDRFNKSEEVPHPVEDQETGKLKNTGEPRSYVIDGGYLRLLPMPDKEYTVRLTMSTTDLVMANNDEARNSIESVDDYILGNKYFADLVVLKAAALIFARCQNANGQIYSTLYQDRRKTFVEQDSGTMQAQRQWIKPAGHYNPKKGLLG